MNKRLNTLDLTDIDQKIDTNEFESIVRIDDMFFASKVTNKDQVNYLKNASIQLVVDLKNPDETDFDDEVMFTKAGIKYLSFPISNIEDVTFEMLCSLKKEIESSDGNKLIYCMSANRVGAVFTLLLSEVLGHPKERSFEFGCKVGMNKEGLMEKVRSRINLKDNVA
jgi:protein tyrosine phosphatase (PTP) superfamily phosphohydrolase (DUF442 family)